VQSRELHGDGDDGITAVTDFKTDTVVIAGMGTAITVVPRQW